MMRNLSAISIGGFRSLSGNPQRLDCLSKVNAFVGPNNAGKSNVLRFVSRFLPAIARGGAATAGLFNLNIDAPLHAPQERPHVAIHTARSDFVQFFHQALTAKKEISNEQTELLTNLIYPPAAEITAKFTFSDPDAMSFGAIGDLPSHSQAHSDAIRDFAQTYTGGTGPHTANIVKLVTFATRAMIQSFSKTSVFVPAFRTTQSSIESSNRRGSFLVDSPHNVDFNGATLISDLHRVQNPDIDERDNRRIFKLFQKFVRDILEEPDAEISVPHTKNKLIVTISDRVLPLSSLGAGVEEVLILGALATVLSDSIVCIEEPELHLHPELQRKLIAYLHDNTSNQYFISTHSASIIDTGLLTIFECVKSAEGTAIRLIETENQRFESLYKLGYRASDIAHANCVVWVEGPSDKMYLTHALNLRYPKLRYGRDYCCMFYGGALIARLSTNEDPDLSFVTLSPINRKAVILIDSDRSDASQPLSPTKLRILSEFDKVQRLALVTDGREIENYLSENAYSSFLKHRFKGRATIPRVDDYTDLCTIHLEKQGSPGPLEKRLDKIELADWITKFSGDPFRSTFWAKVDKIAQYISGTAT